MTKKILYTAFWVICASTLLGQGTAPYLHRLAVEDGLSQGTNYFIYKDTKGFVWLSSLNGLNRYDGLQVKHYQPDPDDPHSMYGQNIQSPFFETKENDLWFSTWEGLNHYVRKHDDFEHFVVKDEEGAQLLYYHVFHLDKDENLWVIVSSAKLYHFHIPTKKFTLKQDLNGNFLRALVNVDEEGNVVQVVYIGYQAEGMLIVDYRDGQVTGSRFRYGSDAPLRLKVRKIVQDDGTWWMATNLGLAAYLPGSGELKFYTDYGNDKLGGCFSVAGLDDDHFLVAHEAEGVLVFNKKEKRYTSQLKTPSSNTPGALAFEAKQVYVDEDGVVWLASDNQGVRFFHPSKQRFQTFRPGYFPKSKMASFDVKSMIEDQDGNVWCGTANNGICVIRGNDRQLVGWKDMADVPSGSRPLKRIHKMFSDSKNRIWILSYDGLCVWLPDEGRLIALTEISDLFLDGRQLENGKIVLAGYAGNLFEIKELPGNKFQAVVLPLETGEESLQTIWEDVHGHLFGCFGLREIWVMNPENNFQVADTIRLKGESWSYYQRPGDTSVWVANAYGLARLTLSGGKYSYSIFTEKNGLPSSALYSVTEGLDGKLWLGTNNGISVLDPGTMQFQNFGISDGISALQFNGSSILKRKDGELWFGSVDGITTFYPEKIKPLNLFSKPVITEIRINDQVPVSLACPKSGATNICEIEQINLDYQQNTISFSFAAREYSHPAAHLFRYKMENVDPDWVDAGRESFARYAKIRPGKYVFSIQATNADGSWGQIRNLDIFIKPPFTQTPLFYLLMGAFGVGLIWAIFQYRRNKRELQRQLEEEKRQALESERERIARDVHDDLGSGLSALSLMTEIAQYKSSTDDLKKELLKINSASRELSGKIREVIWMVNAKHDSLASLFSYMNQYALELLDNAEIDCNIALPDPIPDATISGELRRTLFLAFKEALNNILKHAGATKVVVDFSANEKKLLISVKDNGKGFDPSLLIGSTGNGLLNMQARMRDIGGGCQFKTGPKGTEVIFSLGLNGKQT